MKKINVLLLLVIALIICISSCSGGTANNSEAIKEKLSEGNYAGAFELANEEQKADILKENLIAYICKDIPDALKDPRSFALLDAWYDYNKSELVLNVQGANAFGGKVSSYWYYKYDNDKGKYSLYITFNTFEHEEETGEGAAFMAAVKDGVKKAAAEIIANDDYKLSKKGVKNINDLFEEATLYDVKLLPENKK